MKKGILTLLLILLFPLVLPFEILTNNLNPLIFGISFCIINRKLLKCKFITGVFLSVIFSYTAFFIGLFCMFGIAKLVDSIIEVLKVKSLDGNVYIVTSGLIASLSIYLLFTKIFHKLNINKGFQIMLFSYILVPLFVFILPIIFKGIILEQFFITYNFAWLIVVSFFMSFVFNQNRREEN